LPPAANRIRPFWPAASDGEIVVSMQRTNAQSNKAGPIKVIRMIDLPKLLLENWRAAQTEFERCAPSHRQTAT